MKRIAVIGGGWAGIAAAVELAGAGRAVTLFEAGRVLGGRARTITQNGRTLDNGEHLLLGAYRETMGLMRRVGADPQRLLKRMPLTIHNNAGFHLRLPACLPAPLNLAAGLLTARGVSFSEKLATAIWMQGLKWRDFRLPVEQSVAEWLDAAGQTGRLRRELWEPLCIAALNTPAERASAQIFANVLRDSLGSPHRADTDMFLPQANFGQLLPEPAAAWLKAHGAEIRSGHRVARLTPAMFDIAVDGETFAGAILAVAPQHAGPLLGRDFGFAYEPIATVYLGFPAQTALPTPLYGLHGGIGQWSIDRGNGLIACILSGHGEWEALDNDTLAATLAKELALASTPQWHSVIREKRATYSCRPGLARPGIESGQPHLWLAGDYTWQEYPATLEGSVRSGLAAARACLAATAA